VGTALAEGAVLAVALAETSAAVLDACGETIAWVAEGTAAAEGDADARTVALGADAALVVGDAEGNAVDIAGSGCGSADCFPHDASTRSTQPKNDVVLIGSPVPNIWPERTMRQ